MKTKIENFLRELDTEVDVLGLVDIDNIDYNDAFNSIYEMIEDNNGFDIEIIYYSNAIEYLSNNDPSLSESLEIASEMGFTVDGLNSEILASLLASQNARADFFELQNEIDYFFLELELEDEEEEDTVCK